MKTLASCFVVLLMGSITGQAGPSVVPTTTGTAPSTWQTTVRLSSGYEQAKLDWSIPNGSDSPDILSELIWDDLEIWDTSLEVGLGRPSFWQFRLGASYGNVFDGVSEDSDYLYSGREGVFSRSYCDVDGYTVSVSALAGYEFLLLGDRLSLVPSIGYQYDLQKFKDSNLYQSVDLEFGPGWSIPGPVSTYKANWHMAILDLQGTYELNEKLALLAGTSFAVGSYHGTAVWELRDDYRHDPSFRQEATAYATSARLGLRYQITPMFSVTGLARYGYSWTDDGREEGYLIYGSEHNGFNGAHWESLGFSLGAELKF